MAAQPNSHSVEPEVEGVEVESASAIATISKAEITIQLDYARRHPRFWPPSRGDRGRGIQQFQAEVLTLATADEDTARSMFYHLERRGDGGRKVEIEGPTVRMAEIVASCWRNLHTGTRVVDIDGYFVTAQAVAWDLETNYKKAVEVKRRITGRDGRRYSDDMITVTANAAMAIAERNAIFKVVPGALLKKALDEAKSASLGKNMTMDQRRKRAFQMMGELGAKPEEILRVLGRKSMLDVTVEDLTGMHGTYTAIKDGDTTWQAILEDWEKSQPRTEEDIKRDMKTDLDDVELAPDKNKEPANSELKSTEAEPLPEDEQKIADAAWKACKAPFARKMEAVAKALPGCTGPESLRRGQLEMFGQALDSLREAH